MYKNAAAVAMLVAFSLAAQQSDQTHHEPRMSAEGLLKVDTQFYDLSASTGGDFYFWAPGEFATASLEIPLDGDDIVLAYGELDGSRTTFEFPVESGARELAIFCGIQRKDLAVVLQPNGSVARHGDPGVKIQSFQYMGIATIANPAPGVWKLELTGAGKYAVTANVKPAGDAQAPGLDAFRFVELGGRPGHEGWFPIKRDLRKGETIDCRASVSGSVSALQFTFVARAGSVIATIPMTSEGSSGDYHGRCEIPRMPFRVMISGRDRTGTRFQRIEAGLSEPK